MELQAQLQCIQNVKEEWKDDECIKQISEAVKNIKTNLSKAFGDSLGRLSIFQPKESVAEKVLKGFPECIKVKSEGDLLPIQSCILEGKSLKYIPLLAQEGLNRDVGGKDTRGGLIAEVITPVNSTLNVLQYLVLLQGDNYDRLAVNTMKELKKLGLLKKDDIKEYSLTILAANGKGSILRLRFLLEWDPTFSKTQRVEMGRVVQPAFMYYLIQRYNKLEDFKAVLTVTIEMYPEETGLLFQKNDDGKTALEYALEKYGEKETMTVLHEILSPTKSYPILHHVLVHLPQKDKIFTKWFPWAFHLRDHHSRSLHQAIMAAGGKCIEDNCVIFSSLSDDQVQEKDPITTLYPFAAVACGEDGDLERSFELLRRQPGVLDRKPLQDRNTS